MGFNFGVGCCCKHGYTCQPCTCFTFYDPNTGKDTSNLAYRLNLNVSTSIITQCPSGESSETVGGGYVHTVAGYNAGTFLCESGLISSSRTFNTSECSGYTNQSCYPSDTVNNCYGDPLNSNAQTNLSVLAYPDDMIEDADNSTSFCLPSVCVCSLDICSSGDRECVPIPYCPTKINLKWDAYYANLFQENPSPSYLIGDCPWESGVAPYYTCGRNTSCETNFLQGEKSPGQCSYWLEPGLAWSNDLKRYMTLLAPHVDYSISANTGPDWRIIPGDDSYSSMLVTIDCKSNEVSLCEENEIQINYNNKGTAAWVTWQMCDQPCNCETTQVPSKYPTDPLQLSINQTKTINLYNDFNTLYHSESVTFSASISMDIDKATGPPESLACNTDNQCYVNTCISQQTTIPVSVIGETLGAGGGGGTNGVGHVQLQSASAGYAGFNPNSVCIQAAGTQIKGTDCPSARVTTVAFSPWDCTSLLPGNNGIGSRRACFDNTNKFNGWADQMGSQCCSCDCNCCNNNGQTCNYYYADVDDVLLAGSAYGTIDLCNNVILLTIYDNDLNEIGTISI